MVRHQDRKARVVLAIAQGKDGLYITEGLLGARRDVYLMTKLEISQGMSIKLDCASTYGARSALINDLHKDNCQTLADLCD
jgi:hypothetical protein